MFLPLANFAALRDKSGRILILPGNPLTLMGKSDVTLSQRPVDFFMDDGIMLHVYSFTCKGSRNK